MCGDGEFGFEDLAAEYFGRTPSAVEAAAVLLKPVCRADLLPPQGQGPLPQGAAGHPASRRWPALEKKRQQAEPGRAHEGHELQVGHAARRVPGHAASLALQARPQPPGNQGAGSWPATESGLSAPRLLRAAARSLSSHDYHLDRFLFEYFPQGTGFGDYVAPAAARRSACRAEVQCLLHRRRGDDGDRRRLLGHRRCADGGWTHRHPHRRAGPGHPARLRRWTRSLASRLSTVYMPGNKITMLPDAIVAAYTLGEGQARPALSLYVEVGQRLQHRQPVRSCIECVPVVANLRHHDIEPIFNDDTLMNGLPDAKWMPELKVLWEFATVLEAGRGKPSANQNMLEFNYYVDWAQETKDGPGVISIERRKRGSPLDKLVAELMIAGQLQLGQAAP
jgi:exoribonuclease-2